LKLYPQDNETEHFPNLFLSNARNFFFNSTWLESKTIVGVHVLNSFRREETLLKARRIRVSRRYLFLSFGRTRRRRR
jgi:hypothetical protein